MERLAIRLGCQRTTAKSLVIRSRRLQGKPRAVAAAVGNSTCGGFAHVLPLRDARHAACGDKLCARLR